MKVVETALPGVRVLEPDVFRDARGFFLESFHRDRYRDVLGGLALVQFNHSRSTRHVLRGLHAQRRHPQGKLVRALTGSIFDVVADIDPRSPNYRRWIGVTLDDVRHHQLWVPPGYVHGFCVTSEVADVEYACTEVYVPDDQVAVRWNDPELGIRWPCETPILSARDRDAPLLAQLRQ
jgi:dTDP-4-dehydrorhamnose 3,5-epimerase